MKARPCIIRPHVRPERRSEPPRPLMSFWMAIAAIALGVWVGFMLGQHDGWKKAMARTEIIVK